MNKAKRFLSFALCLSLMTACITSLSVTTASANEAEYALSRTQDRSYNFRDDYELNGNYADDLIRVARAQIGLTTDEAGYTEDWCANFANDCARLTGMPDNIIPYNYDLRASCRYMYYEMIENCGAVVIDDIRNLQSGDLVFYYCPESDFWLHVAIVESSDYYLEGNITVGDNEEVIRSDLGYNFGCYMHDPKKDNTDNGHVKRIYVRPNYPDRPYMLYSDTFPDNYPVPTRDLFVDSPITCAGYEVSWVQAVLYQLGYMDIVTGSYYQMTASAVSNFQKDHGLSATGVVNSATTKALEEAWIKVRDPSYENFKTNKTHYKYNDDITVTIDCISTIASQLQIYNLTGDLLKTADNTSNYTFNASELGEGSYALYYSLTSPFTTIKTNPIIITIQGPEPQKGTLKVSAGSDFSPTAFSWNETEYTTSYNITVLNADGSEYSTYTGITDVTGHSVLLPEGSYKAFLTSKNKYSKTKSDEINFTVGNGNPKNIGDTFYAKVTLNGESVFNYNNTPSVGTGYGKSLSWYVKANSDNSYSLINCKNGLALTAGVNGNTTFEKQSDEMNQHWYFTSYGDGYIITSAAQTGKVLKADDGTLVLANSSRCADETLIFDTVSAVHSYTLAEVTAPSATKKGFARYVCNVCGEEMTIEIPEDTTLPATPDTPDAPTTKEMLIGDANHDGQITAKDSLIIQRGVIGLLHISPLDKIINDTNLDGSFSSADSLSLLRKTLDLPVDCYAGQTIKVTYQ